MKQELSRRFLLNKSDLKSILTVVGYLLLSVIIYILIEVVAKIELKPEMIAVINIVIYSLKKLLENEGEIINVKK